MSDEAKLFIYYWASHLMRGYEVDVEQWTQYSSKVFVIIIFVKYQPACCVFQNSKSSPWPIE